MQPLLAKIAEAILLKLLDPQYVAEIAIIILKALSKLTTNEVDDEFVRASAKKLGVCYESGKCENKQE